MGSRAEIEYYRSAADGNLYPVVVYMSKITDDPLPLILEISPGGTDLKFSIRIVEEIARLAAKGGINSGRPATSRLQVVKAL